MRRPGLCVAAVVCFAYASNVVAPSIAVAQAASTYTECNANDFIRRNRETILDAAKRQAVSPIAIVGAIEAECALNRNIFDTLQDKWLSKQLDTHDHAWWAQWAETCKNDASQARSVRLIANKWPVALVLSGYVMSFGPCQIQPRTAILACQRDAFSESICKRSTKDLLLALLSEEASIRLMAVILRYEADIWAAHTKQDVKSNAALLATLYSSGAEYQIATLEDKRQSELNRMGRWVARHQIEIESHLYPK